jgi:phenylalanine-4-hydroxylase
MSLFKASPDEIFGADDEGVRVMGAGILSSFGEMEWSAGANPSKTCRDMGGILANYGEKLLKPNLLPFDPIVSSTTTYPITTYQPTYFVAESIGTFS